MLSRIILAGFLFVFSGFAAAFEILPAETFYNPAVAQSSAWKSIDYANTLANIASLPPNVAKNTKVPRSQAGGRATINKLVNVYSAGVRAQAKRNFSELYIGYPLVEKRFNVPKNDLAAALTVYIAANYLAYINVDLPEADQIPLFSALYAQTRQALRASRGFAKMKPERKRTLFEQLAILGAFPAATRLSLQQQPNPDVALALQDASRRNLEALLNVPADRIAVTPSGLVIQ